MLTQNVISPFNFLQYCHKYGSNVTFSYVKIVWCNLRVFVDDINDWFSWSETIILFIILGVKKFDGFTS